MSTIERENQYIRKWRPVATRGDCFAMSNVAAAYRILENFKLAARWYKRAAENGDGDSMTDWGYCLHHGVGVQRDEKSAERIYRSALACRLITDYSREEAMYHLAVLLIGRDSTPSRRAAARLLRLASADGDYPQAATLLKIVGTAKVLEICICRRRLRPRLANRHCPLHGPHKWHPSATFGNRTG